MATTIIVPPGSTIYLYAFNGPAASSLTSLAAPPSTTPSTLPPTDHVQLYLPYTPTLTTTMAYDSVMSALNGPALASASHTDLSIYYGAPGGKDFTPLELASPWSTAFYSGTVLYIPYAEHLDSVVSVGALFAALAGTPASTSAGSTSQSGPASSVPATSPTVVTTAPTTASATVPPPAATESQTSISQAAGGSSTDSASLSTTESGSSAASTSSEPVSSPTSTSKAHKDSNSNKISIGEVIGGIVGGLAIGLISGALIAWFCFGKRRAKKTRGLSGYESPLSPAVYPLVTRNHEKQHTVIGTSDLSGWRKHLPHERGVDGISHAFKAIFQHVAVHTQAYYRNTPDQTPGDNLSALAGLLSASAAEATILQAHETGHMLEGVLNRWIISRISLRSDIDQSLLPAEFVGIPKHAHWDMETHEERLALGVESKKGFPQALSQWRVLTGFLYGNPTDQRDFKSVRDAKIDQAVKIFAKAYSPWKLPGKEHADRDASLRSILLEASAAGSQLFVQPTTFAFEWQRPATSHKNDVVVSPALVMRMDENGEMIRRANVLIEARCASMRS